MKKNAIALLLISISLGNVYLFCLSDAFVRYVNADMLYLPTLFTDIFVKGGRMEDWFLPPAPYFFPDFPVFLIAYFSGSDTHSRLVLLALIQPVLTLLVLWFLAKQIAPADSFFTATSMTVALIWLAMFCGGPFYFIFVSTFHYGSFLIAVAYVACWMKSARTKSLYPLIALLGFLAALSDTIILVQLIAPLIATTIVVSIIQRDFWLRDNTLPLLAVSSYLVGFQSYRWIVAHPTPPNLDIGADKIFSNLGSVFFMFGDAACTLAAGALSIFYISVFLHFLSAMIRRRRADPLPWLTLFSFCSICAILVATAFLTNVPVRDRYLIAALSWPLVISFLFLRERLRERFVVSAAAIAFLATASMSWASYDLVRSDAIRTQWRPDEIACIDHELEKEHLENGIASYWDAKYVQNFSRRDLNIAQYRNDLAEDCHITSKRYFKRSYDFAIFSEKYGGEYTLPLDSLERMNGPPRVKVACGDMSLLIYGKDRLLVPENAPGGPCAAEGR